MRKFLLCLCFFGVCSSTIPCHIAIKSVESAAAASFSECVMEADSLRVLYQENGDTRLPMASTTKIATAITVLKRETDLNRIIQVPAAAAGVEGSSVYLKEGEEISIRDLLYGLMLSAIAS